MKSPLRSHPRSIAAGGVSDAASSVTNIAQGDGERPSETPLTGTTAAKVKAAAWAKYPGATVDRVETDSDGAYEAHILTQGGDNVEVQVDKSFIVTGSETFPAHGDGGHHEGRDDFDSSTSTAR